MPSADFWTFTHGAPTTLFQVKVYAPPDFSPKVRHRSRHESHSILESSLIPHAMAHAQDGNRLESHSCDYCRRFLLPGLPEEIFLDTRSDYWEGCFDGCQFNRTKTFNALGFTLADLETRSHPECEFAKYLEEGLKYRIHDDLNTNAVHVFTRHEAKGILEFCGLVHMKTIYSERVPQHCIDWGRCYTYSWMNPPETKEFARLLCGLAVDEGLSPFLSHRTAKY